MLTFAQVLFNNDRIASHPDPFTWPQSALHRRSRYAPRLRSRVAIKRLGRPSYRSVWRRYRWRRHVHSRGRRDDGRLVCRELRSHSCRRRNGSSVRRLRHRLGISRHVVSGLLSPWNWNMSQVTAVGRSMFSSRAAVNSMKDIDDKVASLVVMTLLLCFRIRGSQYLILGVSWLRVGTSVRRTAVHPIRTHRRTCLHSLQQQ